MNRRCSALVRLHHSSYILRQRIPLWSGFYALISCFRYKSGTAEAWILRRLCRSYKRPYSETNFLDNSKHTCSKLLFRCFVHEQIMSHFGVQIKRKLTDALYLAQIHWLKLFSKYCQNSIFFNFYSLWI